MKKSFFALFIALFFIAQLTAQIDTLSRPKVGLVLSGGGAKGFAHVGVLKVLEELGIPVDMIGGTSIGSIVGGFYAMGYSADEIEALIQSQDWEYLLSDGGPRKYNPFFEKEEQDRYSVTFPITGNGLALPSSMTKGQNIHKLFSRVAYNYHDVSDFSKLPIPFFCVASDINSGDEVVLDKGYLPWCIKASMAVPMAFEPMDIDGRKLVDGGIRNNFPVDVMLEKGADIIIGVDITDGIEYDSTKELNMVKMVGHLINFFGHDKYVQNVKDCDIYIHPDISGFSGASFSVEAADSLYIRGEKAAQALIPQLVKLRDSLQLTPNHISRKGVLLNDTSFVIKDIVFHGIQNTNMSFIKGKMDIEKGSRVSLNSLEMGIDRAYGSKLFDYISYRVEGAEGDEKNLHLYVKEAYSDSYNIGLHYDNVNDAALLLNGTWRNYLTGGSRFSVNLKLATNIAAYAGYTVDRGASPGYSIEAIYNRNNIDLYEDGEKAANMTVDYSRLKASLHSIFWDRFAIGIGSAVEYIDLSDIIVSGSDVIGDNYVWHHIHNGFIKLDTRDEIYFPHSGFNIDAEAQLVTENGVLFKDEVPPLITTVKYQHVVSPCSKLTNILFLNTRFIFGENVPSYYDTRLGGHEQLNFFNMMVPFVGLRYGELAVKNAFTARYDLRYNFYKKHYLTSKFNVALASDNFDDIYSDGTLIMGGGLSYSTSTLLGPVELNLMLSDYYKKLSTFISFGYWF